MSKQQIRRVERVLKILGNNRRLQIITLLSQKGALQVGDVADEIHISFQAASQHLRNMEAVDILERERQSNAIYYQLNRKAPFISEVLRVMRS